MKLTISTDFKVLSVRQSVKTARLRVIIFYCNDSEHPNDERFTLLILETMFIRRSYFIRPYVFVSFRILSLSASVSASASIRHFQFDPNVDG